MQTKIDLNFCSIINCPRLHTSVKKVNMLCDKNNIYYCKFTDRSYSNRDCVYITQKGRLRKNHPYFSWFREGKELQVISAYLKCKKKHSVTT